MFLLHIGFIKFVLGKMCVTDLECNSNLFPDFNKKFCVDNQCMDLKRGGHNCIIPEECASYSYYGPIACSDTCSPQTECSLTTMRKSTYCCISIPLKGECNPERPGALSGCSPSHVCIYNDNGKPVCTEKHGNSWVVGCILSVGGNILINLGMNFQKKSYTQAYCNIFRFPISTLLLGSIVYFFGKIISFSAYIYGSQSMLAGLSSTGLITNSFFAPFINDEKFTTNDGIAILLVIIGTSFILSNTSKTHTIYSLCELLKLYKRIEAIYWFSFIIFMIIFLFLFIKFVEINSDWELPNDKFRFLKVRTFINTDEFKWQILMILAYVCLSSFIASFTTLSAKSLGEILERIFMGESLYKSYLTYFFGSTLVLCTIFQIYWLNRALKHYDALLVVPIFHTTWTILSIFTAGIYFQDFGQYTKSQIGYFIVGMLIVFMGSAVLGLRIYNKIKIPSRRIKMIETSIRKNS